MNKCIWCRAELKDGFFCPEGGTTKTVSRTGEKTYTKSLCFESFLTMYSHSKANNSTLTEEENTYLKWKGEIKEWYKSLPYEVEKND